MKRKYKKEFQSTQSKTKFFIGLLIIGILIYLMITKGIYGNIKLKSQEITIQKGDSLSSIIEQNLSRTDKFFFKIYNKLHSTDGQIFPGTHNFDETTLSKSDFIKNIQTKPEDHYSKFTVLEGRSIYDIDNELTQKNLISTGEYIKAVSNPQNIIQWKEKFPFLDTKQILQAPSLEGFLLPDTYHIRPEKAIEDLINLQLKGFKQKIRTPYKEKIAKSKLSFYDLITLASIVEKEEKNTKNKPTVAGIFMNRISKNMLLGADITLCYNYKKPYSQCTDKLINQKIYDKTNPYNTRMNGGLTPTPIGNPSVETILATLNYKNTDYLYYLHNTKTGQIYYGKTLEQHDANKKYM